MFNDEKIISGENLEQMARAYTENLKDQGFYFIKLTGADEINAVAGELASTIQKLIAIYKTNKSHKAKVLLEQILKINTFLESTYILDKDAKVRGISNFEELIGLEANLILKLRHLSELTSKKEPWILALDRLEVFKDLFLIV